MLGCSGAIVVVSFPKPKTEIGKKRAYITDKRVGFFNSSRAQLNLCRFHPAGEYRGLRPFAAQQRHSGADTVAAVRR
jgi:hypothetical protein